MGRKKILCACLAVLSIYVFQIQEGAAQSKFQEYQDSLFAKIPVKPGDVIDSTNWQLVKDLMPELFVEYVKTGQYVLKIGKYGFDAEDDQEWKDASVKNAGKYDIEPKTGEIIEKATGKYPKYLYGLPFSKIDPKDPFAGSKILFNHKATEFRGGSTEQHYALALVGEKTGFERDIEGWWWRYRYWCRPDGEQPNQKDLLDMTYSFTLSPYDLAGSINLTRRPLGDKPDASFTFIPAVRRIRRLGAADRSQPSLGTDGVRDDTTGWSGRNSSMEWKYVGEQLALQSVTDWAAEKVETMVEKSDGSWTTPPRPAPIILGYQNEEWKGAPWAVQNIVWIPVEVYIVEALAKDPYYAYGPTLYWIKKSNGTSVYKVITNRAGELWKIAHFGFLWDKWWTGKPGGPKMSESEGTFWFFVDEKLRHATLYDGQSNREGKTFPIWYLSPRLKPSIFTLRHMRSMAK
ncbi:MAG: DUF1329 domain-containing protein [Thermodesulfobacteriota bacterium]|nr:DUF1329 domain-containing protein [Thermodesulfobacteriota bacterium]